MYAKLALRAWAVLLLVVPVASSAALLSPAPAQAADYRYWYASAQTKLYPTTSVPTGAKAASAGSAPTLGLSAARGEAEGRLLALRGSGVALNDVWIAASNLTTKDSSGTVVGTISSTELDTFKVGYVTISSPSYGYSRKGVEPDPLLPMTLANGERLGWRPGGQSAVTSLRAVPASAVQPYYVLFNVPGNATPGSYRGTLTITARGADGSAVTPLTIPVALTVRPFSVQQRTLKTSFGMNMQWAMYTNTADHKWLQPDADPGPGATRVAERTTYKADQLGGWYRYLAEHRVSPQYMLPAWETGSDWAPPNDAGDMRARDAVLADYLGTGAATTFPGQRFAFTSVKAPEVGAPSYVTNPFSSGSASSKAARYYSTMSSELGSYRSRAIVYPVDEPSASERSFVERYAAFVHKYAPGLKFFLTTDPITQKYRLVSGVDIYGQRLHFYFRDYEKWVRPIRSAKKGLWLYSHVTVWQKQAPAYLIDQPLTGPRAQGWYVHKTRADGLLYFNINAWRPKMGSSSFRDPYKDPLSYRGVTDGKTVYGNGDGSLVYPGYYPALGLYVEGSPPVGSLRMESLRDGIEDYEYLKLIQAKYGIGGADYFTSRVIGATQPKTSAKVEFAPYQTSVGPYESARAEMSALLSSAGLSGKVKRVADDTRFSTAVRIAREGWGGSGSDWRGVKHVVLASGDDRAAADPLAAAGLCWAYDAPLLLVSASSTPNEVKTALREIADDNGTVVVHVVGGPASVPDARLRDLSAYVGGGRLTMDRLLSTGGRYELSAKIAREMKRVKGVSPSTVLVANGADATKFFDALALSPIAAAKGYPILLVESGAVPRATRSAISELKPSTVIVGGGPATVSDGVARTLGATRWSDRDRYSTATRIASNAIARGWLDPDKVGVAAKLPDALSGGAMTGSQGGPLVITDGAKLSAKTATWMSANRANVSRCYVFGGERSAAPMTLFELELKLLE